LALLSVTANFFSQSLSCVCAGERLLSFSMKASVRNARYFPALLFFFLAAACYPAAVDSLCQRMVGHWNTDFSASTLPAGFPKLRSQTMELQLVSDKLRCLTERVTLSGERTRSEFTAGFDGKPYPVTGIPDITAVKLTRYRNFVEANFFSGAAPLFGYRLQLSDGTLIVTSLDPATRKVLTAKIVYRRI
jgi:hypothetical protein